MNRLAGRVAVITGAAGGIGGAGARAFAAEGAAVGLLDRGGTALQALAAEIGASALPLPADVTDEESVAAAFAEVERRFGRLDVLYNCAAIQLHGRDGRAHEIDVAVWQRTLAVNLTGVFLCCRHGIRLMLRGGRGGSIINCGSPTGLTMAGRGYAAYSSTKGGVMALTRELAADYARDGIRVNSIVPGATRTPLTEALFGDPATEAEWTRDIPLGRLGAPADLTGIAVFLASDESAYATGALFPVDGGISVR